MSEGLFTFADGRRWNTPSLENRFSSLQEQEQRNYLTEARKAQINREMCHLAFEGLMRQRETNEQEAITGQLELNYSRVMSHES